MVYNRKDMKSLSEYLSELEMEQDRRDLEEIQIKMMEMNSKFLNTADSLRAAATKLDRNWANTSATYRLGTGLAIGGILMVGSGIASVMTGGVATPFLAASAMISGVSTPVCLASGIGLVVGGTVTGIGAHIYEQNKNSEEIKKAEYLLSKLLAGTNEINEIARRKIFTKGQNNLMYLRCLAKTLKLNDLIQKMLSEQTEFKRKQARGLGEGDESSDDELLQADFSKIIWDTAKLGSTIKDVVLNKGSQAAKILRKKADELEKLALSREKIMSTLKSGKFKQSSHDLNAELHSSLLPSEIFT